MVEDRTLRRRRRRRGRRKRRRGTRRGRRGTRTVQGWTMRGGGDGSALGSVSSH
jgi:hypothetical protein